MSTHQHPRLAPLAARLRALGGPGYATRALDLANLGGELCSNASAVAAFEHLIGEVERLTREARERDDRAGLSDLRERVAELEAELGRAKP